jgi:hypothetical protein
MATDPDNITPLHRGAVRPIPHEHLRLVEPGTRFAPSGVMIDDDESADDFGVASALLMLPVVALIGFVADVRERPGLALACAVGGLVVGLAAIIVPAIVIAGVAL